MSGTVPGSVHRYVWAYNDCGHSEPTVLCAQELSCRSSFTRIHAAGTVAPVDKTVTYGTVDNIPGEATMCWITRNLGASQQATAVDDDSEASAGWYWQFNRKQGYKHDGITRTPNTPWTDWIGENSDRITANDPCNIELGSIWRLPTYTEWYNVNNIGGWTTSIGPWGSGLKLHFAGYLAAASGVLSGCGYYGFYWSSTLLGVYQGWHLQFTAYACVIADGWKSTGYSIIFCSRALARNRSLASFRPIEFEQRIQTPTGLSSPFSLSKKRRSKGSFYFLKLFIYIQSKLIIFAHELNHFP